MHKNHFVEMVVPRTTDDCRDRVSMRDFKKPIANKQELIEVLKKKLVPVDRSRKVAQKVHLKFPDQNKQSIAALLQISMFRRH